MKITSILFPLLAAAISANASSLITFTAVDGTLRPSFRAVTGADTLLLNGLEFTLGGNEDGVSLLVNGQVEGTTDCAPVCTFSRLSITIFSHTTDTIILNTNGITLATLGVNGAFLYDEQTTNHIDAPSVAVVWNGGQSVPEPSDESLATIGLMAILIAIKTRRK